MSSIAIQLLSFFLLVLQTDTYRILAVVHHHVPSHFRCFEPYFVKLIDLGHDLTIVSHYRLKYKPNESYRFVDLEGYREISNASTTIEASIESQFAKAVAGARRHHAFLKKAKTKLRDILDGERFDLVILQAFKSRSFVSLVGKLDAPFIYISSTELFPHVAFNLRNPTNPSFIPSFGLGMAGKMTFVERIYNTLHMWANLFWYSVVVESLAQSLVEELFNSPHPSLYNIEKNASLLLVNSHFAVHNARPRTLNVIEVGGIQILPKKLLIGEFETFINESKHGVVYFCMGSLLRSETFPEEKKKAFLYAFSKIPQRVLWKWEGDTLPEKSANIKISKWMPQRDILAHPNVKLFISHGGLLGTSEAVYEGVPVLGIPIFGDQRTNIKALEAHGAGEMLDYNEISGELVLEKVQRLLNDPKYKENAKQLSERYKDRPMSPLDTAIYWTEYVIRHKGAPHLKSAAADLAWYQYLLLDVIAFIVLVLVIALWVVYFCVKQICRCIVSLVFGGAKSKNH